MAVYGPYPAKVVPTPHDPTGVHDGDTVYLDVDLGFAHRVCAVYLDGSQAMACRVYGINAPELNTEAGQVAAAYARTLLPLGTMVTVISHSWDKYGGRFDGTIGLPDGTDFGERMIASGNAVPYP